MQIRLPGQVGMIITTLENAGFEAYAVGGCVRDSLLGREPEDWDITTNAKPAEVKSLFRRTIDTGIQHGTVTVMFGKNGYEVTTYRVDGEYEDGRHPKKVEFTASLREDLRRRDFTINAMAYRPQDGLVDCFGGALDLKERRIRCVGDAAERFGEDALRMMRAVRFSAQLSFTIEEKTLDAVRALADSLRKVSAERIQAEFVKLLCSPNPDRAALFYETGLSAVFLPEFDDCMRTMQNHPHHCYSVGEHLLHAVKAVRADRTLRLAMFFHDFGKPRVKQTDENGIDHFHGHAAIGEKMTEQIMRRLKFDTDTIRKVCWLVRNHDLKIEPEKRAMRRAMAAAGMELFPELFEVKAADISAQSDYLREEKYEELARLRAVYEEVVRGGDCVCVKDLAVTGRDLIGLGIPAGPGLGAALKKLLALVVEEPAYNKKEILMTEAERIWKEEQSACPDKEEEKEPNS